MSNTKYKLARKDYMEIYDMDIEDICKYTKKQIAEALSQLAAELHEAECSNAD